jgi:N-acetylneuraminic acid mutarotase
MEMKSKKSVSMSVLAAIVVVAVLVGTTGAQGGAPTVVSYQGQVTVGGTPYTGTGYFKFAILDGASAVQWSNASMSGGEPNAAVSLAVSNGLFNVLLGDSSLPNMAALPASAFSGTERTLRVWFSSDGSAFTQLSPDRQIAAVPYALQAEEAKNADTVDGQHASELGLPSGAIVLGVANDSRLTAAGLAPLLPWPIDWGVITTDGAPLGRAHHTAVWTGSEMLIWGGSDGSSFQLNTGGRYDPATDTWTAITTSGAPSGRENHTAVWTGSEMLVWGGQSGPGLVSTGGRYDPATDTWTAITTSGAPTGRRYHTAVWTGSEMLVWGGSDKPTSALLDTGGRYDPATFTWTAITTDGAPTGRRYHTAVWTGSEMLVWGGWDGSNYLNTGGRYYPTTDSWKAITTDGAPSGREYHTAVWAGSEMLVWGGYDGSNYLNTGGWYMLLQLYQKP